MKYLKCNYSFITLFNNETCKVDITCENKKKQHHSIFMPIHKGRNPNLVNNTLCIHWHQRFNHQTLFSTQKNHEVKSILTQNVDLGRQIVMQKMILDCFLCILYSWHFILLHTISFIQCTNILIKVTTLWD